MRLVLAECDSFAITTSRDSRPMAAEIPSASSDEMGPISAINVTPFVDVVLVLLVIFMVTAPALMKDAIGLHLPKAATADAKSINPLGIAVTKQGQILINGQLPTHQRHGPGQSRTSGQSRRPGADQRRYGRAARRCRARDRPGQIRGAHALCNPDRTPLTPGSSRASFTGCLRPSWLRMLIQSVQSPRTSTSR